MGQAQQVHDMAQVADYYEHGNENLGPKNGGGEFICLNGFHTNSVQVFGTHRSELLEVILDIF